MRTSTAFAFDASVSNLQRRQSALSDSQERLTSGKRVEKASDDPAAAAQAERALAAKSRVAAQQRALDASRNTLTLSESALGDAGEIMQQAREIMVNAGNGSYTDADRKTLADKLQGLRTDLLNVANRTDGTGRYLFGGQGSSTAPFVDSATGVSFNGTSGQLQAATGEASPLSVDGRAAWLQGSDPANAGGTLSVFDAMDSAVAGLRTTGRTSAQIAQAASDGITQIDAVSDNLSAYRSRAGEGLNRADGMESRLSQYSLDAEKQRSTAEDLDMVSAISEFQTRQSGYDAALKTYSLVQRMSLFDYIK